MVKQTLIAVLIAVVTFAVVVAMPSEKTSQQSLVKPIAATTLTTAASSEGSNRLAEIDADLRRPLVDPGGVDAPATAAAGAVLLGTSVDAGRSMALIRLPDGTNRWLSLGETTRDGYLLKRVDRRSVTLLEQGRSSELPLQNDSNAGGATP